MLEIVLTKFWASPKSGALDLSLFSAMVNPRMTLDNDRLVEDANRVSFSANVKGSPKTQAWK